jgi:hypothetical protein
LSGSIFLSLLQLQLNLRYGNGGKEKMSFTIQDIVNAIEEIRSKGESPFIPISLYMHPYIKFEYYLPKKPKDFKARTKKCKYIGEQVKQYAEEW